MSTERAASRWGNWVGRAKVCFKAAAAIDTAAPTLGQVASALQTCDDALSLEAAAALREAEAALQAAREAVESALAAKKLTPENREPTFSLQ